MRPVAAARTVIVDNATFAPGPTTSVSVLVVLPEGIGLGEKLAVTLLGSPSAVSVTAAVAPLVRVIVMGAVTVVPCAAVTVAVPADTVMPGVGMVSAYTTVLSVTPVPVARNVSDAGPAVAFEATLIVAVLASVVPVSDCGANETVTPVGAPSAVNATAPE